LTTASEFETGHDDDDGQKSNGSQSDSDMYADDEIEQIAYRKVNDLFIFSDVRVNPLQLDRNPHNVTWHAVLRRAFF